MDFSQFWIAKSLFRTTKFRNQNLAFNLFNVYVKGKEKILLQHRQQRHTPHKNSPLLWAVDKELTRINFIVKAQLFLITWDKNNVL